MQKTNLIFLITHNARTLYYNLDNLYVSEMNKSDNLYKV